MPVLTPAEIEARLSSLPDWNLQRGEIVRTFKFQDFLAAMRFVNQVAALAQAAGHHPDIDIRYDKVRLAFVSHDAGGITEKDFALAAQVNPLFT